MDWTSYILGLVTLPILIGVLGFVYAILELSRARPKSDVADMSPSHGEAPAPSAPLRVGSSLDLH